MQRTENGHLFLQERQEQIMTMLQREKKLLVSELCEEFKVSPATIRNDLKEMEAKGKLTRTHGGAIANSKRSEEKNSSQKKELMQDQKTLIGLCAAEMVEEGDAIAIDSGTTAMEFAKAIAPKHNLTIITNDIEIALYLEQNSDSSIVLVGGSVRRGFCCTVGSVALDTLRRFQVDKCFIGTNGLTIETGLSTPDISHAEVKKQMMKSAAQVIVMCDSSKIGNNSFCMIAPVSDVDVIITDEGIGPHRVEAFEAMDVEVRIAYAQKPE